MGRHSRVMLTCQKSAMVWDSGPCVAMYAGIRGSCSIWSRKGVSDYMLFSQGSVTPGGAGGYSRGDGRAGEGASGAAAMREMDFNHV